jgi:hypothetical protein
MRQHAALKRERSEWMALCGREKGEHGEPSATHRCLRSSTVDSRDGSRFRASLALLQQKNGGRCCQHEMGDGAKSVRDTAQRGVTLVTHHSTTECSWVSSRAWQHRRSCTVAAARQREEQRMQAAVSRRESACLNSDVRCYQPRTINAQQRPYSVCSVEPRLHGLAWSEHDWGTECWRHENCKNRTRQSQPGLAHAAEQGTGNPPQQRMRPLLCSLRSLRQPPAMRNSGAAADNRRGRLFSDPAAARPVQTHERACADRMFTARCSCSQCITSTLCQAHGMLHGCMAGRMRARVQFRVGEKPQPPTKG